MRKAGLLLVLVVSAVVRLIPCRAYVFIDEGHILFNVAHFVHHHTLLPSTFYYPTLYSYLIAVPTGLTALLLLRLGVISTPADFITLFEFDSILPLLGARLASVAFGLATIAVVFRIGTRFFSKGAGLLAAALLGLSQLHIGYSALALPETATGFFVAICLYCSLAALDRGGRWFPLAGAAAGLAATTKYNAAMAGLAIVAAYLLREAAKRPILSASLWFNRTTALTALALVGAFVAGSPGWLMAPRPYWDALMFDRTLMAVGHLGSFGPPYLRHAELLWTREGTTALLFGAGVLYACLRPTRARWVLAFTILLSFLVIGAWATKNVHYLLFLFPALAVLGADAVCDILRRTAAGRWAVAATVMAVLAWPAWSAGRTAIDNLTDDNRWTAARWIEASVPPSATVVVDWSYVPRLIDVGERDRFLRVRRGDLFGRRPPDVPTYRLVPLVHRLDWLLSRGTGEYLVASDYQRYVTGTPPPEGNPLRAEYLRRHDLYAALVRNPERIGMRRIMEFGDGLGPRVLVFERVGAGRATSP